MTSIGRPFQDLGILLVKVCLAVSPWNLLNFSFRPLFLRLLSLNSNNLLQSVLLILLNILNVSMRSPLSLLHSNGKSLVFLIFTCKACAISIESFFWLFAVYAIIRLCPYLDKVTMRELNI